MKFLNREGYNLYSTIYRNHIFMEFVEIKKISSWPWEFVLYISYEVKWKIPDYFDAQAKVKIFSSFSCVHSEELEVYYNVEKKISFLVLTITLWIGWVFILLYKNNNKIKTKTNKTATKTPCFPGHKSGQQLPRPELSLAWKPEYR